MKYFCQCGSQLKSVRITDSDRKGLRAYIIDQILIVKKEWNYKCPRGCFLEAIDVKK